MNYIDSLPKDVLGNYIFPLCSPGIIISVSKYWRSIISKNLSDSAKRKIYVDEFVMNWRSIQYLISNVIITNKIVDCVIKMSPVLHCIQFLRWLCETIEHSVERFDRYLVILLCLNHIKDIMVIKAIRFSRIDLIIHLYHIGYPVREHLRMESIVKFGNLEFAYFAMKIGIEWTKHTCEVAAKYNQLNIIKWADSQGLNYYCGKSVRYSLRHDNPDMLEYLVRKFRVVIISQEILKNIGPKCAEWLAKNRDIYRIEL